MESAFGVDHGEFSKGFNPMKAFKGAQKVKPASATPAFKPPWEGGNFKPSSPFHGASGPLNTPPSQRSPVTTGSNWATGKQGSATKGQKFRAGG